MIINPNNKDMMLKGTIKRGFNQDPNELRAKLHPNVGKINVPKNNIKPTDQKNKVSSNDSLRETLAQLRRLNWKYTKLQLVT